MINRQKVITFGYKTCFKSIKKLRLLFGVMKTYVRMLQVVKNVTFVMFDKYTVIFVFLLVLVGCEQKKEELATSFPPQCIEAQSVCTLDTANGKFSFKFDIDKPIAEQPFYMYVNYNGEGTLHSLEAFMEGANMYMGKVPLFFEDTGVSESRKAMVLLGSCTEDKMIWKINFIAKIEFAGKVQQQVLSIELASFQQ